MDYKEQFSKYIENRQYEEAKLLLEKYKVHAYEDSFYYANMGWILNHMELYEEAEVYLQRGIAMYPGDAWMFSQLGFSLDRQGRVQEGLNMLLSALEMGFDEPWLHGEIGWCYKDLEDYKKAITYFENALLDDTQNTWLLAQAAYAYMQIEDIDTAEEYYLKSYQLCSDDDARFDLILFYKTTHNYTKQIECLKELKSKEYRAWKHCELGVAYNHKKMYKKAVKVLDLAISYGRDETNVRSQLGDAYLGLGQKEEAKMQFDMALSYYEKALVNEEEPYWIYQEMIWIAHKCGDSRKKLEYLDRAVNYKEKDLWLMYHYARTYSDLYKHTEAIEACDFCIANGEDGKEMLDLKAWNLGRVGKEQEALDILLESIAQFGEDEWTSGEIGWNYAQLKDYVQSTIYFEKACSVNKKNPMHISMLGWCYLRQNEFKKALSYLKRALALGRNDGWLYSVMAETYLYLDEPEQALTHYQLAIDHRYEEQWVKDEIKRLKKMIKKASKVEA